MEWFSKGIGTPSQVAHLADFPPNIPGPEAPRLRAGGGRAVPNQWDKIHLQDAGHIRLSRTRGKLHYDMRATCDRHHPCSWTMNLRDNKPAGALWFWLQAGESVATKEEHGNLKTVILEDFDARCQGREDFLLQEYAESFLEHEAGDPQEEPASASLLVDDDVEVEGGDEES